MKSSPVFWAGILAGMNNLFVSVIVPVYNDSARLVKCLEALRSQTYPQDAYEVIVVDNASEQDIRGAVSLFQSIVYTYESHPGPAAARNKGIGMAKGTVIAFTDSDGRPNPNWIEKGVERLLADPGASLAGGEIEVFFQNQNHPTLVELFHKNYFKQRELVEKRNFSAAANLFVRREVFERAGLFDDTFDLAACEDREWGERVHAMGFRIVFAEKAVVMHPSRRTLSQLASRNAEFSIGNYRYEVVRYRSGHGDRPSSLGKELLALFKPPFRSATRYFKPVEGVWPKAKMYGVVLFDHYTRVWANIRVRIGWHPGRILFRKKWSSHE